jgi:Fur family ferric uptake transcriptional regulator
MEGVTASKLLVQAGLENTAHRRIILAAVADAERPVTATEVGAVVGVGEKLNKVTLYRNLELLVECGLLRRHSGPDRCYRYCRPSFASPSVVHCHVYCSNCGVGRCVEAPRNWIKPEDLLDISGFEVGRVEIRLEGLCSDCRKKA